MFCRFGGFDRCGVPGRLARLVLLQGLANALKSVRRALAGPPLAHRLPDQRPDDQQQYRGAANKTRPSRNRPAPRSPPIGAL